MITMEDLKNSLEHEPSCICASCVEVRKVTEEVAAVLLSDPIPKLTGKCQAEGCDRYAVKPTGTYCSEHGCCLCGKPMAAETEGWKVHLCESFLHEDLRMGLDPFLLEDIIEAAFDAGVEYGIELERRD